MSSVFDTTPVPAAAEGLDIPFEPAAPQTSKFSCAAGEYPAICTKMEKVEGKDGKPPRLKLEVTLVGDGVKGIRATRFFDLSGEFAWTLGKAVEAFGVKPEKNEDGTSTLKLKQNYHRIVSAPCVAQVKPRDWNGKTFMDIVTLKPAAKSSDSDVPF